MLESTKITFCDIMQRFHESRSKEIKAETSLIYYFQDCVNICGTPHKKVKPVLTAKQKKFRIRSELLVDCCPKIIKPKKNSKKI